MNTANNNKHPLVEGPNQGAKQLDQEGAKTLEQLYDPRSQGFNKYR